MVFVIGHGNLRCASRSYSIRKLQILSDELPADHGYPGFITGMPRYAHDAAGIMTGPFAVFHVIRPINDPKVSNCVVRSHTIDVIDFTEIS